MARDSVAATLWHILGRRGRVALAVLALMVIAVGGSGGCYAHRTASADVTPVEQQLLQNMPLPYTVAVVPWEVDAGDRNGRGADAHARALADLLARSGAFKGAHLGKTDAAELVAVPTGVACDSSVVPVFTVLTAGVIPTVFDGERCDGWILRSARGGAAAPVEFRVSEKGQVVFGWPAAFLGLTPGWSYGHVGNDSDYSGRVRLELARNRTAVEALATQEPPTPPPSGESPAAVQP
jgi:hypothetical protein